MKNTGRDFYRALSIVLTAAILFTMTPQTAMPVLAASEDDPAWQAEAQTAEGEDLAAPAEGEEPAIPAEGEAPTLPVEGEEPTLPVEGENPTLPVEGEEPTLPVEGEEPTIPAEGENPALPVEGEEPTAPAEGEISAVSMNTMQTNVAKEDAEQSGKIFSLVRDGWDMVLQDVLVDGEPLAGGRQVISENTIGIPWNENNKYGFYEECLIPDGSEKVTFDVLTRVPRVPDRIVGSYFEKTGDFSVKTVRPAAVATNEETGIVTASYELKVSELPDKISFRAYSENRQLTMTLPTAGLEDVRVSLNGRMVAAPENAEGTDGDIAIPFELGANVQVFMQPKDAAMRLKNVSYRVGDREPQNVSLSDGVADFSVKLFEDVSVSYEVVPVRARTVGPLLDSQGAAVSPVNGVYKVDYDGVYRASVLEGGSPVRIDEGKLTDENGNSIVPINEGEEIVSRPQQDVSNPGASVDPVTVDLAKAKDVAGKKLFLTLTVHGSENDEEHREAEEFVYILQTMDQITSLSQIQMQENITQTIDTVKSYPLSTGSNLQKLKAALSDEAQAVVESAVIRKKEGADVLELTTKLADPKDAGVKLFVYDERYPDIKKEIMLKTVASIPAKAPTAQLKYATDTTLTLSVSAKTETAFHSGMLYYKVEAALEGTSDKLQSKTQYFPKQGDAQEITLNLAKEGVTPGNGEKQKFTVKVSLVHAADQNGAVTENLENIKFTGPVFAITKPLETQAAAWETKLGLKKARTTVYTGEGPVFIAEPVFKAATTYREIEAAWITDMTKSGSEALTFSVNNGRIYAEATKDTWVGKHTVMVRAAAESSMYAAGATMDVTVVKGIHELEVSIPADCIYKPGNKSATLKATAVYNGDVTGKDKSAQPKTKKVKWDIVRSVSRNENGSVTEEPADAAFREKVKIKNGTVTVAKEYQFSPVYKQNQFVIKLTVDNDKAVIGENLVTYSKPITITRRQIELKDAAVLKKEAGRYRKLVGAGGKTTREALAFEGAFLAAFDTVPLTDNSYYFHEEELQRKQITENLRYTSSNQKAVGIDEMTGEITVKAPAKNVKLTVTAMDGGKSKREVTVTVEPDDNGKLGLLVEKVNETGWKTPEEEWLLGLNGQKEIAFQDTAAAIFRLTVRSLWDDFDSDITEHADYKIQVSGKGKLIPIPDREENAGSDKKYITVYGDQAVVKLTYKTKVNYKWVSQTDAYTLTNKGLVKDSKRAKAPKIVFDGKRSSVKSHYNANDPNLKRWEGMKEGEAYRYIGFSIQPNGRNYAPDPTTARDLYAKVDMDWSAMADKNKEAMRAFAEAMYPQDYFKLNDGDTNGHVELRFGDDLYGDDGPSHPVLTPGSYKLKVSIGTIDENRKFVLAAEPANITVKVEADKKLTFTPAKSYKIAAKENAAVELTGKKSDSSVIVAFSGLKNASKKNGQPNRFLEYFELAENSNMLRLRDSAPEDANGEIAIPKEDLTGYVDYEAYYSHTDESGKIRGTVMITLSFPKKGVSYAVSSAIADKKPGSIALVNVTADKRAADIAYAVADSAHKDSKGDWEVVVGKASELVENEWVWLASSDVDAADGVIALRHTGENDPAGGKAVLRVIPRGSYYEPLIRAIEDKQSLSDAEKKTAKEELIKKYGIELKASISLKDVNDKKTKKRIAVDAKNQKLCFTGGREAQGNLTSLETRAESGYAVADKNYYIDVPYTELLYGAGGKIQKITVDEKYAGVISCDLQTVDREEGEAVREDVPVISIALNKDELVKEMEDTGNPSKKKNWYNIKTVNGQTVCVPKQITVNATVQYRHSDYEDQTAAEDVIKFYLTTPAYQARKDADKYKTDFALAIEDLKQNKQSAIEEWVGEETDRNTAWVWCEEDAEWWKREEFAWIPGQQTIAAADEAIRKIYEAEARNRLKDALGKYLAGDCGIDIDMACGEDAIETKSVLMPTQQNGGEIKLTVTFTNGIARDDDNEWSGDYLLLTADTELPGLETEGSEQVPESDTVTFTIKYAKSPAAVEDVKRALQNYVYAGMSNDTPWTEIVGDVYRKLKESGLHTKDINVWIDGMEIGGEWMEGVTINREATFTETGLATITFHIEDLLRGRYDTIQVSDMVIPMLTLRDSVIEIREDDGRTSVEKGGCLRFFVILKNKRGRRLEDTTGVDFTWQLKETVAENTEIYGDQDRAFLWVGENETAANLTVIVTAATGGGGASQSQELSVKVTPAKRR